MDIPFLSLAAVAGRCGRRGNPAVLGDRVGAFHSAAGDYYWDRSTGTTIGMRHRLCADPRGSRHRLCVEDSEIRYRLCVEKDLIPQAF